MKLYTVAFFDTRKRYFIAGRILQEIAGCFAMPSPTILQMGTRLRLEPVWKELQATSASSSGDLLH